MLRAMPLRFVHCSDIHLLDLRGVSPHRFLNKRLTGGVNLLLKRRKGHDGALFDRIVEHARSLKVDRLVVTGDVTNLALESEFELVRRKLDDAGVPITVIPGNHDAYTRGAARTKRFERFFKHHMEGERTDDADYPFVWHNSDGDVALIGLSTAIATRPLSAVGELGPAQLGRLDRVLETTAAEGLTRVVLIHHPVGASMSHRGHELLDLAAFGRVIARRGAELILHGHEHDMMEYVLRGPDGDVPVHGISSGTARSERPQRRAGFAVYTIGPGRIEREVWRRQGEDFAPESVHSVVG